MSIPAKSHTDQSRWISDIAAEVIEIEKQLIEAAKSRPLDSLPGPAENQLQSRRDQLINEGAAILAGDPELLDAIPGVPRGSTGFFEMAKTRLQRCGTVLPADVREAIVDIDDLRTLANHDHEGLRMLASELSIRKSSRDADEINMRAQLGMRVEVLSYYRRGARPRHPTEEWKKKDSAVFHKYGNREGDFRVPLSERAQDPLEERLVNSVMSWRAAVNRALELRSHVVDNAVTDAVFRSLGVNIGPTAFPT